MSNVIALDIGGTSIKGALLKSGKIKKRLEVPTRADKSMNEVLDNIISVIHKLKEGSISGVGIGMPGFTTSDGVLASAPNLPSLEGHKIGVELRKKIKVRVKIDNDANCFALAEHELGAGKGTKNMIGIIMGTGYGVGIIIDGNIYRGSSGGAGEYGHSFWSIYAEKDFESICSGTAISRNYRLFAGRSRPVEDIFKDRFHAAPGRVIDEFHRHLALTFSYMINLLNPERIVIGGGVSKSIDYPVLNELVKRYSYHPLMKGVKVVKARLGDDAGILGAATLLK